MYFPQLLAQLDMVGYFKSTLHSVIFWGLFAVPAISGIIGGDNLLHPMERARVNSGFIRHMSELNLLIPGRHIKLLDTIGQGAFCNHFRAHNIKSNVIGKVNLEWYIEVT